MPRLRPRPNLDAVLLAVYMMDWCRQRDIDGKKDFPEGAIMGELDWHCELYQLLYEDEHSTHGCVVCKGERMSNPNDRQVGGEHYRKINASYQHWDLVADTGMNYYTGQVTKYLARWRSKNGVQDIEKAVHYCDKLVALVIEGRMPPATLIPVVDDMNKLSTFVSRQGLSRDEEIIFERCVTYQNLEDLQHLQRYLVEFLTAVKEGRFGQTTR